jgi:thiol:disulfide interchange protein
MLTKCRTGIVLAAVALAAVAATAQDPFAAEARLARAAMDRLSVTFRVPAGHQLYGHAIEVAVVRPTHATLTVRDRPTAKRKYDELLEQDVDYYDQDVVLTYDVQGLGDQEALTVAVSYQGCKEDVCFMPQQIEITVGGDGDQGGTVSSSPASVPPSGPAGAWQPLAERFEVIGTATGYLPAADFLSFLREAEQGTASEGNFVDTVFRRYGLFAALLAVIPLGLLLNLTPCVLPMIPVNLAIIGAGQSARSRHSGFVRGAVYGAGMALVYGMLGVVVVLTGSRFGALNSSPWFNAAIALVFIVLGLAMFDVLVLDLSRFQRGGTGTGEPGRAPLWAVFLLGGTAALLAGACVAPVLIWVLLLATDLYAQGTVAGLLLPLMLGLGMALPWPIAGAGLSVLPRPGAWMNRVKHAFGVLILLFAGYYAILSVRLLMARHDPVGPVATAAADGGADWTPDFTDGLQRALAEGRPVLLDFWALTCKSCAKMKKTTFKDAEVLAALEPYVLVAFQTDRGDAALLRAVPEHYGVLGLPTYVVLRPKGP